MKPIFVSLLLAFSVLRVSALDSTYRDSLKAAYDRFAYLESVRADYRKSQPALSPDQEQERLRLHGQLLRDDPVWALHQQIYADIKALEAISAKTASDKALIETLKNLLSVVTFHGDSATTREQADEYATALRQFVARRDYEGARVGFQESKVSLAMNRFSRHAPLLRT